MGKLYNTYIALKAKEKEENTLYLFKSGIFFLCIDEDAKIASRLLHLKLTNLNESIVKCGFPIKSLDKYSSLISLSNYKFKIIDTSTNEAFTVSNYSVNDNIQNLLQSIAKIDTDNLSIREAYTFLDDIKKESNFILGGIERNGN